MFIKDVHGDRISVGTFTNIYGEKSLEIDTGFTEDSEEPITLYYFDLEAAQKLAAHLVKFLRNHPDVEPVTEPGVP